MIRLKISDRDELKSLLDDLGVAYSDRAEGIVFGKPVHGEKNDGYPPCEKVDGYPGFYCQFEFDEDGKFEKVGVWE